MQNLHVVALEKPKQNQIYNYLVILYANDKEKAGDVCGFKEMCHIWYNWVVAEFFLQRVRLLVIAGCYWDLTGKGEESI